MLSTPPSVPGPVATAWPAAAVSPEAVDRLNQRAYALRHEDAEAALALCQQAKAMSEVLGYAPGLACALLRESLLRYILGAAPEVYEPLLERSLEALRRVADPAGEAEALNLRGNMLVTRGAHAAAIEQFRLALALRRSLGQRDSEAAVLNNLGMALRDSGQLAESLEVLLQSLELAREQGVRRSVAYAQLNIGVTLKELGDPAQAAERFEEVLVLATGGSDIALLCSAHVRLGEAQMALGRYEPALQQLHRGWQLAQQTANAGDLAHALCALGAAHQELGAFATAEERLQAALPTTRLRADVRLECEVLRLLGRNQVLQGRPQQALPLLERALDVARSRGGPNQAAAVHELLAQAHEMAGQLAEALANLREFQRCRDRVQGQTTLRRAQALLWQQQLSGLRREAQDQRSLNESLAHALEAARQAEQQKAALLAEVAAQAEALRQLAREDGLTQVANRRWFDTQWPRELERARRHQHPLAVAMVDVDDFKSINDRFSHAVGDEVLRRVARLLRDHCRSNDLVARYGGEEFVLMFVETALDGAVTTCEKLRGVVQRHDWSEVHAGLSQVTVSIGVACWTPARAPRNVLGEADAELYRAKRQGKNQVCAEG